MSTDLQSPTAYRTLDAMRAARDELLKRIDLLVIDLSRPDADPAWRHRARRAKVHMDAEYRQLRETVKRWEHEAANQAEWDLIGALCDHLDDLFAEKEMPASVWETYRAARTRIGEPVQDEEVTA